MSATRDTLVANAIQQACALLLLLVIPNILPVEQFAEVVFVGVVLSFTRFSDLGLANVYSRDLPRHHASDEKDRVRTWNRTMLWFGVASGGAAGAVAAGVMYARYGSWFDAAAVGVVPPLTAVVSTYISMSSVRSDFRAFRNAQAAVSLSRLLAVPLAGAQGVAGWLVAQGVALALVIAGLGRRWVPLPARIDWALVARSLPAGLQLALITLLWTQVLDCGRLLASIHYPPAGIAAYGLLVAAAQSLYSVVIAAYLPVTVKTFGKFAQGDAEAAAYVFDVAARTVLPVFALAIAAAELSPWLLRALFPAYTIDPVMPWAIFCGLTVLPFFAPLGNLFIGKRATLPYLAILAASLAFAVAVEAALRPTLGMSAAAIAQASATALCAFGMLAGTRYIMPEGFAAGRARLAVALLRFAGLWSGYLLVHFALRLP